MNIKKRYDSISLKYRSVVLEREIHEDAMLISSRDFLQELKKALDSLPKETKEKYNKIMNPSLEIPVPEVKAHNNLNNARDIELGDLATDSSDPPGSPQQEQASSENLPHEQDTEEKKGNVESRYKEVYRKLALKLHPDRLVKKNKKEKAEKLEMFKEIQTALSNGNYSSLLRIANILGVEMQDVKEQDIRFLKDLIDLEEDKISKIRASWAWNWYHENNTSKKEEIMLRYVSMELKK